MQTKVLTHSRRNAATIKEEALVFHPTIRFIKNMYLRNLIFLLLVPESRFASKNICNFLALCEINF